MKRSPVKSTVAFFSVGLFALTACGGGAAAEAEPPSEQLTETSLAGEVSETISGIFSGDHAPEIDIAESIDRVPAVVDSGLRNGESRELTDDEHEDLRFFVRDYALDFVEATTGTSEDWFQSGGSSVMNSDDLHVVSVGTSFQAPTFEHDEDELLTIGCEMARGLTLELVEDEIPVEALDNLLVRVGTTLLHPEESDKSSIYASSEILYDFERNNRYRSEHC